MKSRSTNSQGIEQIERQESLVDLAYARVRNAVISGQIQEGEQLNQLELAKHLGVSQRTVREAIAHLISEGLAVREPHKGTRVVSLHLHELEEIYELRALLEGWAVELAAEKLSSKDLEKMRRLLPATVPTGKADSIDTVRRANRDFHWTVIEASGKKHLIRFLKQLWGMLLISALPKEKDRQQDFRAHKQLLEALEDSDGRKARRITEEHILQTFELHRK
jgi:DNA-binding GntR family transcriptional regulator